MRLLFAILVFLSTPGLAQNKMDIFTPNKPITYLGADFSQAIYIGRPGLGYVGPLSFTNDEIVSVYLPKWNAGLEDKNGKPKLDFIGGCLGDRGPENVIYATGVTDTANSKIVKIFFSELKNDVPKVNRERIAKIVSEYNFNGRTGLGMIFFVQGLKKDEGVQPSYVTAYATFVNMEAKTILFMRHVKGYPGGTNIAEYWAKSFVTMLKYMQKDWKQWAEDLKAQP